MDIEQEAKDLCEQCQYGASVSDVMEIVWRIAEQAVAEALVSVSHAVAEEREACAKVCDDMVTGEGDEEYAVGSGACAEAIRMRSNAKVEADGAASCDGRASNDGLEGVD